eukprot:CAMPEP_0182858436 /NCGR_PEP_ID=MMETSP0034_2-20130328/3678_1 /TAXON_ID=156128 /ORGANISM="Nephroselmis pyriformis, Strain CCMP717" /LENGTH=112 /DNA_ID=CAMNT_0024989865 /DNA_START=8 /DNA_END=346 /DNA_ORIENTATION=+
MGPAEGSGADEEDSVEAFALDPDFDYDDIKLTPKFWPFNRQGYPEEYWQAQEEKAARGETGMASKEAMAAFREQQERAAAPRGGGGEVTIDVDADNNSDGGSQDGGDAGREP